MDEYIVSFSFYTGYFLPEPNNDLLDYTNFVLNIVYDTSH